MWWIWSDESYVAEPGVACAKICAACALPPSPRLYSTVTTHLCPRWQRGRRGVVGKEKRKWWTNWCRFAWEGRVEWRGLVIHPWKLPRTWRVTFHSPLVRWWGTGSECRVSWWKGRGSERERERGSRREAAGREEPADSVDWSWSVRCPRVLVSRIAIVTWKEKSAEYGGKVLGFSLQPHHSVLTCEYHLISYYYHYYWYYYYYCECRKCF